VGSAQGPAGLSRNLSARHILEIIGLADAAFVYTEGLAPGEQAAEIACAKTRDALFFRI
jgi:TRAP-type uncharacterized transport system substrate-binding protein